MSNSRILILVPSFTAKGGILTYFKVMQNKFSLIKVDFFTRGAKNWPYRKRSFYEIFRAVNDLLTYTILLYKKNYDLVQTNTSLGILGVIRDGFFILIGKLYNLQVIVFFHGWNWDFKYKIEKNFLNLFKFAFFKADAIIVLSSEFKDQLKSWGYNKQIYVETTVVDEDLLVGLNENSIVSKYEEPLKEINFLFLARIEISKGIYETIKAYQIIKKKYPKIKLTIAGDGLEMKNVKKYIRENKIIDVKLLGYVNGKEKIDIFSNSHVYVFPSYTEGMPTSILEAMAFGLPVITRPVGGVIDIFKNGENGFMTDSKDPEIFSELIENLISDKSLMQSIALNNFNYAKERFVTSKVIARLEKIINNHL